MEEQAALIQSRAPLGTSVDDGTWGVKLEEHHLNSRKNEPQGPNGLSSKSLGSPSSDRVARLILLKIVSVAKRLDTDYPLIDHLIAQRPTSSSSLGQWPRYFVPRICRTDGSDHSL